MESLNWLDQLEPSNEAEWLVSELKQGGNVDQNYLFLNLISKNLRYFIYQIKNETFVMESIGLMLFTRKINDIKKPPLIQVMIFHLSIWRGAYIFFIF
ncbi:hypothetical protein DM460_04700 [Brevibacillus laterosporus]|uniref:Uncharacterized protein n=1 Tax=Brevibacillus laterosporus LMG 15441 TaxID=1042163 RepID=A0A075R242_BRELA|nr:hypothetical protein BRLA_c023310 [Brevibacillus laterosporus LMG 15441]RJL14110.1 hypothetical protein DM460_04700 [Brevibacillus laterosporus]